MKEKKTIYFLLLTTLIIWFAIAYKVWVISDKNNLELKDNQPILIQEKTKKNDGLTLDYEDPFFKKNHFYKKNQILKINTKEKEQKTIWPIILYKGMIDNSSKKVALFNFNGKDIILQEGEEFHNIKCQSILQKKAIFIFSKEKKEVLLK